MKENIKGIAKDGAKELSRKTEEKLKADLKHRRALHFASWAAKRARDRGFGLKVQKETYKKALNDFYEKQEEKQGEENE